MKIDVVKNPAPVAPMAQRGAHQLRIGQFNAHNFFDTKDDPSTQDPVYTRADYKLHVTKLGLAIRDAMGAPDIITMEEVENLKVLQDLCASPALKDLGYKPLLRNGNDPRGIDNAILYRDSEVQLTSLSQIDPVGYSEKGHAAHMFTRPPLVATFAVRGAQQASRGVKELTVIAAHFTSKLGGEDAAVKRAAQARTVADFVTGMVALNAKAPVMVAGDLNMEDTEPEFAALRHTTRDASLTSLNHEIDARDRYSWRDGREHLMLDHMLASTRLASKVVDVQIPRISTQLAKGAASDPLRSEGVSDHDPMVATFRLS